MLKYIGNKIDNMLKSTVSSIFTIGSHIPKSIAIIMDGNRRYAQKKKVEKIKGHEDGLSKLLQVLLWCIDFEVKELTVFAFSIDNFNRSKEEVESLMKLTKEKFAKLSEQGEYLSKYGVKVCFYGNLSFLDEDIRNCLLKMERDTELNTNIKLNVCFPYNSTEEIYQSVDKINTYDIEDSDASVYREQLESNLYGGYNLNPEILIRTSGEIRLSNFLLYQTRFSILFFIDKFWPDFTYLDFLSILIRYNLNYNSHMKKIKELEEKNNFMIRNIN
jgi:ditrans,polycis-polyprenyl diphosphate synthase